MLKILVVGTLDISELENQFPNQVEKHPLVPWARLPEVYNKIDINLAPIEFGSEFTRCKSDLKYFEASFMKVPTVASSWGEFARVIKHRETGMLCHNGSDWYDHLLELIQCTEFRVNLGEAAYRDVHITTSAITAPDYFLKNLQQLPFLDNKLKH